MGTVVNRIYHSFSGGLNYVYSLLDLTYCSGTLILTVKIIQGSVREMTAGLGFMLRIHFFFIRILDPPRVNNRS